MNEQEREALYEAERVRRRREAAGGRQARDAAIQQVDEHADDAWKEDAYAAVAWLTERSDEFTTDDVWAQLNLHAFETHERRAMGAIMRRAQREGLIEPTARYQQSTRAVCHCAPKRVWRTVR